jgi:hypothetical protein
MRVDIRVPRDNTRVADPDKSQEDSTVSTKTWIDKNRSYRARILKRFLKSQICESASLVVAASRMLGKPQFKSLPQEHH